MLYRVNVKPAGDDVRDAVKLPSFDMIVETNISGAQLKQLLSQVKFVDGCPARYITINSLGKRAKRRIKSGISIGEAVALVDNTLFDISIKHTVMDFEPLFVIEDEAKSWSVWNKMYCGNMYHFFRYKTVDVLDDYENKMFKSYGITEIARALYQQLDICLHKGKDCYCFESDKYSVATKDGYIVILKNVEKTTVEHIKY